jgi:hypothetical protein
MSSSQQRPECRICREVRIHRRHQRIVEGEYSGKRGGTLLDEPCHLLVGRPRMHAARDREGCASRCNHRRQPEQHEQRARRREQPVGDKSCQAWNGGGGRGAGGHPEAFVGEPAAPHGGEKLA